MFSAVLEFCRECVDTLEIVEASEGSDAASLSDAELSSRYSSGIDSVWKSIEIFGASGRIIDHGGDSCSRSVIVISSSCTSHSSSFFVTQGFCVHRSFEK
jgi:hypothetical protein